MYGFLYLHLKQDLPQPTDEADTKTTVSSEQGQRTLSTDQSMKIAWRYQNQPKFEVSLTVEITC